MEPHLLDLGVFHSKIISFTVTRMPTEQLTTDQIQIHFKLADLKLLPMLGFYQPLVSSLYLSFQHFMQFLYSLQI